MGDHHAPADRPLVLGLGAYRKSLIGFACALAAVAATVLSPTPSPIEWLQVLAQAVVLLPTYYAPNMPGARYTKLICSAVGAALAVIIPVVLSGDVGLLNLPVGVYVNAGLAGLGTLGVWGISNRTIDGTNVLDVAR